jgi:hypothetical protein
LEIDVAADAKARTAAAEALEAELLAHLEAVRAYHRARAPIDPVAYDFPVGNVLWAFDALRDWSRGVKGIPNAEVANSMTPGTAHQRPGLTRRG